MLHPSENLIVIERDLIPSAAVIQERLARNYREASLLRSLLRLASRAARDRLDHERAYPSDAHRGPGQTRDQAARRRVAR
jgi:hypothetical protein